MEYRTELHGWRRLWAMLRHRPWAWVYEFDAEFDDEPTREDGKISYAFTVISPITVRALP